MAEKRAISQVDRALARLGSSPHGVFTLTDVRNAGLSSSALTDRVRIGALFRLHRGVYSIAPPELLRVEGRWLAAVLACGAGAALSHTSAAALWDLLPVPSGPIHITVPSYAGRRKRRGITVHRSDTLLDGETNVRRAIRATTPARTLSDLRRALPRHRYEAVVRRAEILRLDTGVQRGPDYEASVTGFERRLLALCRRHALPTPLAQQVIGPFTVDFLWPAARLVVEMDDFRTHGTRSAFESDRARDAWLTARGYRVVRFTWRQLQDEPATVVATLRRCLG